MYSVSRVSLVVLICGGACGQQALAPLAFEVASIRPAQPSAEPGRDRIGASGNRFVMMNQGLTMLINFAYDVPSPRILGGPDWVRSEKEKYDVVTKAEGEGTPTTAQFRLMFQSLLADRFKLAVHREAREIAVYALVVGKGGPKLREVKDDAPVSSRGIPGSLNAQKMSMATLAGSLASELRNFAVTVVDETGLKGEYAFTLEWDQYELQSPVPDRSSTKPSIFTAVQEQLGLKLESVKRPVDYLIIDHAEKPSEN